MIKSRKIPLTVAAVFTVSLLLFGVSSCDNPVGPDGDSNEDTEPLTLSGTATVEIDGSSTNVSDIAVWAYTSENDPWGSIFGADWSVGNSPGDWTIETETAFAEATTIYFGLDFTYDDGSEDGVWVQEVPADTSTVQSGEYTGIDLNIANTIITLSGTATATVAGVDEVMAASVALFEAADFSMESGIGESNVAEDGSWSLSTLGLDEASSLYAISIVFVAESEKDGVLLVKDDASVADDVKDQDVSGITISADVTAVWLSGTVDGFNTSDYDTYSVYLLSNDEDISNADMEAFSQDNEVTAGTDDWDMPMVELESNEEFWFMIEASGADKQDYFITTDSHSLGSADQTEIELNKSTMDPIEFP